jgi:hypothetical protein
MSSSYRVYIDESGDEGFVFKPDGSGSSRWLVLSATAIRKSNDIQLVHCVEECRRILSREPKQQLHFRDLRHEQRVAYIRNIAALPLKTVSILVYKPCIHSPERFQNQKFLLYRYITRFLLERVSWLCRDNFKPHDGDGTAEIIFSNRSIMSYTELTQYLDHLKTDSNPLDISIDWSVIQTCNVRAIDHAKLAGLQIADAVASSLFYAVNKNYYGDVEPRYAAMLEKTFYRFSGGKVNGYGIKFWPDTIEEIKRTNPHIDGLVLL